METVKYNFKTQLENHELLLKDLYSPAFYDRLQLHWFLYYQILIIKISESRL